MKYAFIDEQRGAFKVNRLCKSLGIKTSSYYRWKRFPISDRTKRDKELLSKISKIHQENRGCYGSPRIHAELKEKGDFVSRKRVSRIMRENGISALQRRKYKSTTDSNHNYPVAPNLLNRIFTAKAPNKIWTADITYVSTWEGWLYLAVVLDLYSRKVVGWAMSTKIDRNLVINAFLMAYFQRKPEKGLIHHSDRGSQYCSNDFQAVLKHIGALASMSGVGNCYDNSVTETFFHTLKVELIFKTIFKTREEAKMAIFEYVETYYNRKRKHSTLGYCSPNQFEQYSQEKVA